MYGKREYGDYQTPIRFAEQICRFLKTERGIAPKAVLEPTCGIGNLLKSSLLFDADAYYGIEINPEYCSLCGESITDKRVTIINEDFFCCDMGFLPKNDLLMIGNPPWATNSELSAVHSENLPRKTNFKQKKGMAAMTGESNFDICEYIILRLLNHCRGTNAVMAMLCKTSVARNVFQELKRQHIDFANCEIVEINAKEVFGISASACLLFVELSETPQSPAYCNIYSFDDPHVVKSKFGYRDGRFYSDLSWKTDEFDGKCCFEWRQGVKHDCSKVMELSLKDGALINGKKEVVEIEPDIVFPLIKSSMFKQPVVDSFSKYVIVTQRKAREETAHLERELPLTWTYLNENREYFERRKSSIYRNAPAFSMFGVGEYSYAKYKVGVSGFYKTPMFSLLWSDEKKTVMTDDTSYFICFPTYDTAYVAMLYLNSDRVQDFLKRIAFLDAKRPYTKKVLDRIDFSRITKSVSLLELTETEKYLGLSPYVTGQMVAAFTMVPEMCQQSLI